jgi:hypothetical protein
VMSIKQTEGNNTTNIDENQVCLWARKKSE